MTFTRGVRRLLQGLALCLGVGMGTAVAQNPSQHPVMQEIGALVWEMMEIHTDFGQRRSNRGMTPQKVEQYARKVATQLVRSRESLAQLHKKLPPGDAFASDLARFLKRWPDEKAFYDSLFAQEAKHTDNLGGQLYELGSQAHDTRSKWKTPFPFFRP